MALHPGIILILRTHETTKYKWGLWHNNIIFPSKIYKKKRFSVILRSLASHLSILSDSYTSKYLLFIKLTSVHLAPLLRWVTVLPCVLRIPPSLAHPPLMMMTEGTGASYLPWINKSVGESWLTAGSWSIFTQYTLSNSVHSGFYTIWLKLCGHLTITLVSACRIYGH